MVQALQELDSIASNMKLSTDRCVHLQWCQHEIVSEFLIILSTKTGLLSIDISEQKGMEMKIEHI